MTERGVSPTSALRVIQEGQIFSGPDKNAVGDWQCTLRRRVAGLPISVVLVIEAASNLIVIAVFEDRA